MSRRAIGALVVTPFVILCLAPALQGGAKPFVEVTAELQADDWDYWFFTDRIVGDSGPGGAQSIFRESLVVTRCVVGSDTWMIEHVWTNATVTYWFTGTNIIEHSVVRKETPEAVSGRMKSPSAGQRRTWIYESADGNPGRPVRVADLMGFDTAARVFWLAFCSGPSLRRDGRRIFPPSPIWKEYRIADWGWSDQTEVFKDGLALPKSINLVTTNNQSIFEYQVRQSTNLLGWSFPLQFYGVHYLPAGTNGWKLHLTLKGRVTAISPSTEPQIPAYVMEAIEE